MTNEEKMLREVLRLARDTLQITGEKDNNKSANDLYYLLNDYCIYLSNKEDN